jgi:uncharacterized membrane protein
LLEIQASYFARKSSHSATPILSPLPEVVVVVGVLVVAGVVVVIGVLVVVVVGVIVVVAVLLAAVVFVELVVVVSDPPQAAKLSAQETDSIRETKNLLLMGNSP